MPAAEPLSLAYSPCPNDTYIFAAWATGLLDGAPPVRVSLDDVETLNDAAFGARYALTKISYGAIPLLGDRYRILRSGGALGRGCGPLLVVRGGGGVPGTLSSLARDARIAIPGTMTTAYLLLRLALGYQPNVTVLRFDRIVDAVASGAVDAGLIIHESRFTYGAQGLRCIADLGEWWEHETGRPIPLGAILVRRDVPDDAARALGATVRASLAYARAHEAEVSPYIREYSQELDPTVIRAHIDLYVNGYSDDVGADGIAAVDELFVRASRGGLIPSGTRPDFV